MVGKVKARKKTKCIERDRHLSTQKDQTHTKMNWMTAAVGWFSRVSQMLRSRRISFAIVFANSSNSKSRNHSNVMIFPRDLRGNSERVQSLWRMCKIAGTCTLSPNHYRESYFQGIIGALLSTWQMIQSTKPLNPTPQRHEAL